MCAGSSEVVAARVKPASCKNSISELVFKGMEEVTQQWIHHMLSFCVCGYAGHSRVKAEVWGSMFKAPEEGQWKCEVCMIMNGASSKACAAFTAAKQGGGQVGYWRSGSAGVSSGSIGAGAVSFGLSAGSAGIGAGGFSFSVPVTDVSKKDLGSSGVYFAASRQFKQSRYC